MDIMTWGYYGTMRVNDTETIKVRWIRCQPGAKPPPFSHAFGSSRQMYSLSQATVNGVGEIFHRFELGAGFDVSPLPGDHVCGDRTYWQQGWPVGTTPLEIGVGGIPVCCGAKPTKQGGLRLGGTAAVRTSQYTGRGGLAIGGSAQVLPATRVGGLALGGVSTFTNPYPNNVGGPALGGETQSVEVLVTTREGGLALGGTSIANPFPKPGEGGLALGGESVFGTFDRTGAGGIALGGTAAELLGLPALSGGLALGGLSSAVQPFTGDGGLALGGTSKPARLAPAGNGGLSLGGTSSVTPTIYIWDKMTGSAGSMAGRTPDTADIGGATWANGTPGHNISGSNTAINASTALVQTTFINTPIHDGNYRCDIIIATAHPVAELAFRVVDGSNLWVAALVDTSVDSRGFLLSKRVSGTDTVVGGYNLGQPVNGHTYQVLVVTSGNTINVYLDGTLRITATDSFNNTATQAGLRSVWNGSSLLGGAYTNFIVYA